MTVRQSGISSPIQIPILLAPAGDWACVKAAVENGADAVYLGLDCFNARMRAQNFTEADLPEVMAFLHQRGVKGYVTLNTLVFTTELADAERAIQHIIMAGADAIIAQDIGVCRLIRRISPDFPIHASTQMTITSSVGVAFAKQLGCQVVVLARECSLKELGKIQAQLEQRSLQMPLEVFVHGALCVAYSGQCLTSESLGGRSANRGECAQACRMTYDLVVDGEVMDLGDRHYLLSPQDLAGLDVLPELICAGVACLKIEGRLKSPEYVANVTKVYRQAIDRVVEQRVVNDTPETVGTDRDRYQLEMAFSRGLYTGWFKGINNQELVHGRFGKKRGVYLGTVTHVKRSTPSTPRIIVRLQAPLKPGDGVMFDGGHPNGKEEGGRVYTVDHYGDRTTLTFGQGAINPHRIQPGDELWKTSDPALEKEVRQSFAGETPQFQRSISMTVTGKVGMPLHLLAEDELGHHVDIQSAIDLVPAHTNPLTTERLRQQLGRLGNTPFTLATLDNQLEGDVMLPVSELNRLRRALVERLSDVRSQSPKWTLTLPNDTTSQSVHSMGVVSSVTNELLGCLSSIQPTVQNPNVNTPSTLIPLIPLIRSLPQLAAVLSANLETIYCEFDDPRQYKEAVRQVREVADRTGMARQIWVAPPRITKPLENWTLDQVRRCQADGYLVRNYDHLAYFENERCVGDFSLNVANPITADYFLQQFGLERLTASYDLNISQLVDLITACPPHWFEVTLHQHMPMFHMEHCVFCAFLSDGTDFTNCGRPCETYTVKLRDRTGAEHPLQADVGCRNTVYNSRAQTGAESVQSLINAGLRHFRIEFLDETPEQVSQILGMYQDLLTGTLSGTELWQRLKLQNQLGVTRGQLEL
ncbi:MAG: U32 family peptidase [Merismopedia sp. SIO2A8]|nr:U32 family peptidase [Merismopedia sp. SIO2A8]